MTRPLIPLVEVTAPNGTKSLLAAFSVSHRDAVATVKNVIPSTYAAELSNRRVPPGLKFGGAHPGNVILIEQIATRVRPPFAAGRDRAEGEEIKTPFCRVFTSDDRFWHSRPRAMEKPNRFATSFGFSTIFLF